MAKWPEKLDTLVEVLERRFTRYGFTDPRGEALDLAIDILDQVLGGEGAYMPKSDRLKAWLRDESIWKAWNGFNKEHLARQHHVSVRHVELLIARKLKEEQGKRQGALL
ncbi:MAG TPA: hypothetical protein DIC36_03365 [Gammaproteobacteria bacterium]|nr:hypothetical protein [Gammaproteobacteria bacterium]